MKYKTIALYIVLSLLSIIYLTSYITLRDTYPKYYLAFSVLTLIPGFWIGQITGMAAAHKDFCK